MHLRRMLYMPAVAAIRCNPILKDFANRLRSSGKHGKQIVAAVIVASWFWLTAYSSPSVRLTSSIGSGRRHGSPKQPFRRHLTLDIAHRI